MVDVVEDVEIIAGEVEDVVVGGGVELLEVVGVVEDVDGVDDAVVGEEELVEDGVVEEVVVTGVEDAIVVEEGLVEETAVSGVLEDVVRDAGVVEAVGEVVVEVGVVAVLDALRTVALRPS